MQKLADKLEAVMQAPAGDLTVGSQKANDLRPNTEQKRSASDKARLSEALAKVCALQKQYGKTTAELETLVEGFCWVLGGYSMDEILHGIARYVRRNPDIPTPADVLNIIDPPAPKPAPLSSSLYVKYQKMARDGHILLSDEREYCRAYEKQEYDKVRGGSDEIREAQRQIENHFTGEET